MDSISRSDTLAALYRLRFLLALGCLQTSCHCFSDMEGAESALPQTLLSSKPKVLTPRSLCTMTGQSQAPNFVILTL